MLISYTEKLTACKSERRCSFVYSIQSVSFTKVSAARILRRISGPIGRLENSEPTSKLYLCRIMLCCGIDGWANIGGVRCVVSLGFRSHEVSIDNSLSSRSSLCLEIWLYCWACDVHAILNAVPAVEFIRLLGQLGIEKKVDPFLLGIEWYSDV